MRSPALLILAALGLGPITAHAEEPPPPAAAPAPPKTNAWSRISAPAKGEPSSIGEYTSGCLRGAAELPLDGPGFQVMHPGRVRYFGHPDLVAFIQGLGKGLREKKVGDVLVGDLSQPRGGPAPGGHSSHQTGLDVDLWYWQPPAAARRALTREERENTSARSVLDPKTSTMQAAQSERVITMLRLTAEDPHVARIFVHPIIKRDACAVSEKDDRAWLRKVRPWFGHDDHFHVRLECPAGATDCVVQAPVPAGDGCAELDWWFSPAAQEDRKKGLVKYQAKVGKAPGMPAQCKTLLEKAPQKPEASLADAAVKPPLADAAAKPPLRAAADTSAQ